MQQALFGGGCFWCTEAVFLQIQGVQQVVSGYAGGHTTQPNYDDVCGGNTGHAEVILIDFDENQINYNQLLDVFFATHDPTTLNRQGNDVGTQYRSVIYYNDETQKKIAEAVIEELSEYYDQPIVTEVSPVEIFYEAEAEHQNYYRENTQQGYCSYVITPKLTKLRKLFADKLK